MEIFTLGRTWNLIAVLFILLLFILITTFDLITHWDDKKKEDTRVLLLGIPIYTVLIVFLTCPIDITIFVSVSLISLIFLNLIVTGDNFNNKKAPYELWVVAFTSILIFIGGSFWVLTRTEKGKQIRDILKTGKIKRKTKQQEFQYEDENLQEQSDEININEDFARKAEELNKKREIRFRNSRSDNVKS